MENNGASAKNIRKGNPPEGQETTNNKAEVKLSNRLRYIFLYYCSNKYRIY